MKKSEIIRNIINDDCYYYTKHSVIEIVNFIFYEHEAQLKAKDKMINSLHQMCEDFDEEVKNKDKEIKWLNELIKKYESDD